jgi:hypothetical protein
MGYRTRVATLLLWFSTLGAIAALLYPGRSSPEATTPLVVLLVLELLAAVLGWGATMRTWARARREHEAKLETKAEGKS